MLALPQQDEKDKSDSAGVRYRMLAESLQEMFFTVSAEGRLLDINNAGVRIFRYPGKTEICGIESMALLFRDIQGWPHFRKTVEAGRYVEDFVAEMRRLDGSCFRACISASLWVEPYKTAVYDGILRDMTISRQLQKSLEKSEQHDQELSQRVLNAFTIMSHDLRGPLVSLASGLELVVRGRFGAIEGNAAVKLQGLRKQSVRIIGTAEDWLARAAAIYGLGEIRREPLDLKKDIIDPVLEEFADEILSGRIRIGNPSEAVCAETITIYAAGKWLRSVYRNLFGNAVKYGGNECTISFGCEELGHCYRLNVYNSGEPIPWEFQHKLFTKFGRLENRTPNAPDGTGLGLYLVREILRRHGGDIWYEAVQTGSNFVFTIPKDKQ
jgi:signal transduction histidine kinase